jgi:hypothetical protein
LAARGRGWGQALSWGRSLPSPAWTLVTPYCKRTRPGRGTNMKAAGFPPLSRRTPASSLLSPLRARPRARPIWAGARGTLTRRLRDPRSRNADKLVYPFVVRRQVANRLAAIVLLSPKAYLSPFYFKLHYVNNTVYSEKQCFSLSYIQYVGHKHPTFLKHLLVPKQGNVKKQLDDIKISPMLPKLLSCNVGPFHQYLDYCHGGTRHHQL